MKIVSLLILTITFNSSVILAGEKSTPIIINEIQRFSLVKQMPKTTNHDIRMRKIVVTSGAKIAQHSHTDRAGMVYVISGEIVEYRNGKETVLVSGDSIVEDFNTIHAYENKSDKDCVLIAFDIPKTKSDKHLEKLISQ